MLTIQAISIDLSQFMDASFLDHRQLKHAVMSSAEEVLSSVQKNMLEYVANQRSEKTLDRVKKAMLLEVSQDEVSLTLSYEKDWFVKLMEEGMAPRDMKPYLLNSSSAKISLSGNKYVRVPIQGKVLTVSELSDPRSWQHPGIVALDLFEIIAKPLEIQSDFGQLVEQKLLHLFNS